MDEWVKCPVCGYIFERNEACNSCPFFRFCSLTKCPRCGYEFFPRPEKIKPNQIQ